MRGLTVRQPWAWAIIRGGKDVENRSRNLAGSYRGPVAIQAGRVWDQGAMATLARLVPHWNTASKPGEDPWAHRPDGVLGAIIGVVDLVDVHDYSDERCHRGDGVEILPCSPWAEPHAWHLVLANPRPLASPIPWRGALGLWPVPADLEAQIRAGATP